MKDENIVCFLDFRSWNFKKDVTSHIPMIKYLNRQQ